MTKDKWAAELQAALDAGVGDWHVFKAWVEQNSPMMYADVASATLGAKRITLALDRFLTAEERRAEIWRQLRGESSNPVPNATLCLVSGGPISELSSAALFSTVDAL